MVGIGQLFRAWQLLYSTAGATFGAGATDVAIRLPLTRVTMVLAFVLAALLIWNIWRRHQWWPITIAVWILALIVLRGIVPAVYQSLVVNPNQLAKEQAVHRRQLRRTRRQAYDLHVHHAAVARGQDAAHGATTWPTTSPRCATSACGTRHPRDELPAAAGAAPVLLVPRRRHRSLHGGRGLPPDDALAARAQHRRACPAQAQTWVNQHITYTHGFGVAMSAVNQVTNDGSPDFLVSDIPPRSAPGLEVTQPRIYYGERGTDYTLVKTKAQEFDYPGPNGDVYTQLPRQRRHPHLVVPEPRWPSRCSFGTIKFFTASAIDSQSRVIIRNNIRDRISEPPRPSCGSTPIPTW